MVHAIFGEDSAGSAGPAPDRPASRWYSVHSDEIGGDGVGVTRTPDAAPDEVEPEAHATVASRTTKAVAALRIIEGVPASSRRSL